nr:hypothetical protein Iba_chr08cCG0800 [Ipomoea batatas]GMD41061.1 hypothetical protein Iba_scaffold45310CG0010 [Ipomoea batatas]
MRFVHPTHAVCAAHLRGCTSPFFFLSLNRKIWTKLGGQNGKLHRIHTLSLSVYTGEVKRRETKSQNWHVREREDDEEEDVTSNFPIFSSPSSFVISGRFQGPPGGFCFAVLREKRSALFFTDSPKSFEDKKRTKAKAKRWKNNRKTQKKQYVLYIYVGFSEESPEKTLHSFCIEDLNEHKVSDYRGVLCNLFVLDELSRELFGVGAGWLYISVLR